MNKKQLVGMLLLTVLQASCKVVNTHTFKVTGGAEVSATEARISTTKGYLSLPANKLSEKEVDILKNLRPFQCISIRTSEPFDMNNREVRFQEFELKSLVEGDPECRKISTKLRFSAN